MSKKKIPIIIFISLVFFIFPPVSAYLDPGFGSMVWQMIAGVAFAAAFTVKIYWQKIKRFFGGNKTDLH